MTTNKLSPDEIKALLGKEGTQNNPLTKKSLSNVEIEALTELLHVSISSSSTVLSTMFSEQVTVKAPTLSIKHRDKVIKDTQLPFFVALGEFNIDSLKDIQFFSIPKKDVEMITSMMDESHDEAETDRQYQMLQQVIDGMFDSITQSMTMVVEKDISYSLSGMDLVEREKEFQISKFTDVEWFVEVVVAIQLGTERNMSFSLSIPTHLAKHLVGTLSDSIGEPYIEETQAMPSESVNRENKNNQTTDASSTPYVQSVQFSNFDKASANNAEPNNLDMLLDIPLQVTVELGRTKKLVKDILELSQGSIIELDKLAGEPVDILVNNKLIAVGEVVVIDENFGVRVTDILSAADRISKLR